MASPRTLWSSPAVTYPTPGRAAELLDHVPPFGSLPAGVCPARRTTGKPQDALFGVVLVTNALIGIGQELRAKRTLGRLAALSAPRVRVIRDRRRGRSSLQSWVPG